MSAIWTIRIIFILFILIVAGAITLLVWNRRRSLPKSSTDEKKSGGGFWKTTWNVVWAIAGLWLVLTLGTCFLSVGSGVKTWLNKPDPRFSTRSTPATPKPAIVSDAPDEYPTSGKQFLAKGVEVKAWLDPANLHTEGSAPVTYELEGHPSFRFRDDFTGRDDRKFKHFPAGRYIVTTESPEEVHFLWRLKH